MTLPPKMTTITYIPTKFTCDIQASFHYHYETEKTRAKRKNYKLYSINFMIFTQSLQISRNISLPPYNLDAFQNHDKASSLQGMHYVVYRTHTKTFYFLFQSSLQHHTLSCTIQTEKLNHTTLVLAIQRPTELSTSYTTLWACSTLITCLLDPPPPRSSGPYF